MVFVHRINCLLTASGQRLPVRGAEVGGCACSGAGSAPSKAGAAGRRGGAASLAACGGGRSSRFPAGLEQAQRPIVGAASELGQEFPAPQQRSTEPRPRASNVPLQLLQLPREPVGSGRLAVGAEPGGALGRPSLLRVRVPGGCSSGHGRLQQKAHATPPYHGPPHPCPASGPRRGDWCVLLFLRTPEDEDGWGGSGVASVAGKKGSHVSPMALLCPGAGSLRRPWWWEAWTEPSGPPGRDRGVEV